MTETEFESQGTPARGGMRAGTMVQIAGASLSLTLLLGVGVWGYKLLVRDANGVPVVQALDGPMRKAPVNPGGVVAPNIGLSVNQVAALGATGGEGDAPLMLAPRPPDLSDEDLTHTMSAEADEPRPSLSGVEAAVTVDAEPEEAVLIQASAEVALADLADLPDDEPGAEAAQEVSQAAPDSGSDPALSAERIDASVPGVSHAPHPPARPGPAPQASISTANAAPGAAAAGAQVPLTDAPLQAGTVLVQLGAYPSRELADAAWAKAQRQFGELITERAPILQSATAGGTEFFRLRMGDFPTLADARRFCSALAAEDAGCIPYMVE